MSNAKNWTHNNLEKFFENYETNENFLNIFFKYYKKMNDANNEYKIYIEDRFLKIIIKFEDEYNVIKYMKKHSIYYKKLLREINGN